MGSRTRLYYEIEREKALENSPVIAVRHLANLLAEQQMRYEILKRQLEVVSHELYELKKDKGLL